jgi:hypothetical protein
MIELKSPCQPPHEELNSTGHVTWLHRPHCTNPTCNDIPLRNGDEFKAKLIMNRGGRGQYARGGYNNRYSPRGGGRGGRGRGAPRSTAPKGVFANGIWHCDCTPRLPAEHFKVKKESKNQGRWFYTCQNQEPQRCGFFVWDEDAKLREEGAVLNNSRSEPKIKHIPAAQDGWSAGRSRGGVFAGVNAMPAETNREPPKEDDDSTEDESPPPAYSSQHHSGNATKRRASTANLDGDHDSEDDELLPWPLTGQEEQDLTEAADSVAPPPETPRKAAKTGVYATPNTTIDRKRTLPWLQQPAGVSTTPMTPFSLGSHQTSYFDSPSKQPTKSLPPISEHTLPPTPTLQANTRATPAGSPSPHGRHRDALSNPADEASSLTAEAIAALSNTSIPPQILDELRGILSRHDLKAQGVVKGRDISRLALKAKDAKIVELQARIASLEAEREVSRGVIRGLRWESEHDAHGAVGEE